MIIYKTNSFSNTEISRNNVIYWAIMHRNVSNINIDCRKMHKRIELSRKMYEEEGKMFKKIKFYILGLVSGVIMAGGMSYADEVYYQLTRVYYSVVSDNQEVLFEKPLLNYNGSTYVALTDASKTTGGLVFWDNDKKRISIMKGDWLSSIKLKTLKNYAFMMNYCKSFSDLYNSNNEIDSNLVSYANSIPQNNKINIDITKDNIELNIKTSKRLIEYIENNFSNLTVGYLEKNELLGSKAKLKNQFDLLVKCSEKIKIYEKFKNENDFKDYWVTKEKSRNEIKDLNMPDYDYYYNLTQK